MSIREKAKAVVNVEPVELTVPAWGGSVWVRPMTLSRQMALADHVSQTAGVVIECLYDGPGVDASKVFLPEDAGTIDAQPPGVINPVIRAINAANHFGIEEKKPS